jgi:quercetin dioxygenase-like cupin family protein
MSAAFEKTPPLQSAVFDVPNKPFEFQMSQSDATGHPLLKHGKFGADLIRFEPGKKVGPHTHPGSHILVCLAGRGVVWYDGEELELRPGVCYLIPEYAPHAVYCHPKSGESLILMAIGNDHRDVDSSDRLRVTSDDVNIEWQ